MLECFIAIFLFLNTTRSNDTPQPSQYAGLLQGAVMIHLKLPGMTMIANKTRAI